MSTFDRRQLDLFTAEVNGEVSDRPMRSVIDTRIRDFYKAIDTEDWDTANACLREDVKLVVSLAEPGGIMDCSDAIIDFYEHSHREHQRTVINGLVVDRGRATCCLMYFWPAHDDKRGASAENATSFKQERAVCVFDLDENYLIKRIELRETYEKIITTKGGLEKMTEAVEESQKNAVVMKEIFGF